MPEARKTSRPLVAGVGISNSQRVIVPASGATKLQLAEFYFNVREALDMREQE